MLVATWFDIGCVWGAQEFAKQLIEKWGISREEFWKLHFNYVQMLPHRVLTGEISKAGIESFQSWYEEHKHDPETLYKFTNLLEKKGITKKNRLGEDRCEIF